MPGASAGEVLEDVRDPSFRSFLDLVRWLAAFAVFASHLRNHVHVKHGQIAEGSAGWLVEVWYLASSLHWEAVSVFFVLSGFLVGGIGTARARTDSFDCRAYALDRVTRIYAAFAPAVILGWALDSVIVQSGGGLGIYDMSHPLVVGPSQYPYAQQLTGEVLYSNLLMLQSFYVRPVGSNLPLWTLSFEFWFYVVFGCGVVLATGSSWVRRGAGLLVAAAVIFLMGYRLPAFMMLWLLGLVAALPGAQWLRCPRVALLSFIGTLIAARVHDYSPATSAVAHYVWEFAPAAAFAWLVFSSRGRCGPWLTRMQRPNAMLASFSFSLYLVHYPVMLALLVAIGNAGADGVRVGYQPDDPAGAAIYLGVFVAVLVLAYGFAFVTERQTGRVRELLRALLPGHSRR